MPVKTKSSVGLSEAVLDIFMCNGYNVDMYAPIRPLFGICGDSSFDDGACVFIYASVYVYVHS